MSIVQIRLVIITIINNRSMNIIHKLNPFYSLSSKLTIKTLLCQSSYSFATNDVIYSKQVLNKLIVTRTQDEKYSLYVPAQLTISQFYQRVTQLFPQKNIGLTTNVNIMMELGNQLSKQKQNQEMEVVKDVPVVDALILDRFVLFEKSPSNQIVLVFGVEIAEYNMSNRLNIPEYIEQGIAQLNQQWQTPNLTVSNALSFQNIRKYQQGTLTRQSGQILQNKLTVEQQHALSTSLEKLIKIKSFNEQIGPYLPSTNRLMTKIIAYLSINWVFLFYLTYGRYGWDVGQPVSYLTGLSVDLIAMMGLFEANRALTTQKQKDKQLIETVTNLKANQNMAKWRVAYLTRKISSSS